MELNVKKNIPFPKKTGKEIIDKLSLLNEGDFVELSYADYSKQHIRHCVYNANIKISYRGLLLKTSSNKTGCGIWVFDLKIKNIL